jgi:hypothetical protein
MSRRSLPSEDIEFQGVIYRRSSDPNNHYYYPGGHSDFKRSLHRMIWEAAHGPIPTRMLIHHRDGDPFNNSLPNLACLSRQEHIKAHLDLGTQHIAAQKRKRACPLHRASVRLPTELHAALAVEAKRQGVSLNTLMVTLLASGIGRPPKKGTPR